MRHGIVTAAVAALAALTGCSGGAPDTTAAANEPAGNPAAPVVCAQRVSAYLRVLMGEYLDPNGPGGSAEIRTSIIQQYGQQSAFAKTARAVEEDSDLKADAHRDGVEAAVAAAQNRIHAGCATATHEKVP